MRSKGSRVNAASKLSLLLARRMSQDTPSTSSLCLTISASRGLSSKLEHSEWTGHVWPPAFPQRTLGARPSNRCDRHIASCCPLRMSAGDAIVALDDGEAWRTLCALYEPQEHIALPISRRGHTTSECCGSCTRATIPLAPSRDHAARIAGSHALV